MPGERHWEIFIDLCSRVHARGNLVADAYLAALAIESGSEWVTTDRDYARFPGLRWRHPF
jgi:predicted nucleic acid-binding protein